jgi:hypothetical protein
MKKEIAKLAKKVAKQARDEAHKQAVMLIKAGMMAREKVKPHIIGVMKQLKKELVTIEKKAAAEFKKEMARMKKVTKKKKKTSKKTVKKAVKKTIKRVKKRVRR